MISRDKIDLENGFVEKHYPSTLKDDENFPRGQRDRFQVPQANYRLEGGVITLPKGLRLN